MNTLPVVIKTNAYGLILILDPQLPFDQLKEAVREKFRRAARFFRNAQMALTFKGRQLSGEEEVELITIIMDTSGIDIACIVDEDKDHAAVYREAVIRAMSDRKKWISQKYR